jgi:hypothetical protein
MLTTNGASSDMPEAFRDDNENGIRDAGETFIDFNNNNAYDAADGKFNGVLCNNVTAPPVGSSAGTCSATKSIHVRGSLAIIFSGSTAVISVISPATPITLSACAGGIRTVDLRIVDAVGNPMPVGTTITAATTNGTLQGTTSFVQANTNVTPAAGVATHSIVIKDDGAAAVPCADATPSGVLTITVVTPAGGATGQTTTTASFTVLN